MAVKSACAVIFAHLRTFLNAYHSYYTLDLLTISIIEIFESSLSEKIVQSQAGFLSGSAEKAYRKDGDVCMCTKS